MQHLLTSPISSLLALLTLPTYRSISPIFCFIPFQFLRAFTSPILSINPKRTSPYVQWIHKGEKLHCAVHYLNLHNIFSAQLAVTYSILSMALSSTKPNTASPPLTPAQTRALLFTLLSIPRDDVRRSAAAYAGPARAKAVAQQPLQRNITIDASVRIVGHCNNVGLASPSATDQEIIKSQQSLNGILQSLSQFEEKGTAQAKANVNLINVVVHTGINIIGSKNVVVVNSSSSSSSSSKRDVSGQPTKIDDDAPLSGRKRRAESVSFLVIPIYDCSRKRILILRTGARGY